MRKVNQQQLLEDRARMFAPHLGKAGEYHQGRVSFTHKDLGCTLGFVSRRSLMSNSHLLSLQTHVPAGTGSGAGKEGGRSACFLNRLGNWSLRGKDEALKKVHQALKGNQVLTSLLRSTHLDSLEIVRDGQELRLNTTLYGGGYSALMLPPLQFTIGIPEAQVAESAKLFRLLHRLIRSELD